MATQIELRRHTDNDSDILTFDGVMAAVEIGRSLRGGYWLVAASPARRAVQTAGCLLAGLGEAVPGGIIVEDGLRSEREDEWRAAYAQTGKGDLGSFRETDPDLVREDSAYLSEGLKRVFDRIEDGQRALAVGHSPTSEAAVFGLTGVIIDPMGKGDGVVINHENGEFGVVDVLRV